MKLIRKILVALSLLVAPCLTYAITLDECQRLARENYPLVRQFDLIRQSTEFTIDNIAKGWLPQVSALAQATYQSKVMNLPAPLNHMLQQQCLDAKGIRNDQYRIGVDISQNIWDGGQMDGQKAIAQAQAAAQSAETESNLYAIRQRVNDLYFGILLIDDKLRLNKELQTLLQSNLDKLNSMLKHGVVMQSDVNLIKAEELKARQTETELSSSKKAMEDMLSLFICQPFSGVEMPADIMVIAQGNSRPELHVFDSQLKVFDAQEQMLKVKLMPRVNAFAQGYYGYPGYDLYNDIFSHKWTLNGIIGVKAVWNISGLYTNKNDKLRLQTQRDQVETARETFLFNNHILATQQNDAIARYTQLLQQDGEIVKLREEVRKTAESKLGHGVIDINDLLQEITRENQARIDMSTHQIQKLKETYDLQFTTNN